MQMATLEQGLDIEGIVQKINAYLDAFLKEEHGNRLSQFSLMALKQVINQELEKLKAPVNKDE